MTTRLTDEQIAELERDEGATVPAPWEFVDRDDDEDGASIEPNVLWLGSLDTEKSRAARLAVVARNALPALLAEVRASRAASAPAPDLVYAAERVWRKYGEGSDWTEWRDLREALDAALDAAGPAPAPEGYAHDPESRLRAFAERYSVSNLDCRFMAGSDVDPQEPWRMTWCRNYEDATSDVRAVDGRDLSDVVRQAEEWEAENDRREPQYAAPRGSDSKERA